MLSNRAKNTKPELAVRKLLHARGHRYRVDYRPVMELRTRGDVVFTRKKFVIFVDGCFWHGCPQHATMPKSNSDYWIPKLAANIERDLRATTALKALGWGVLRFWEHEDPAEIVEEIESALTQADVESQY